MHPGLAARLTPGDAQPMAICSTGVDSCSPSPADWLHSSINRIVSEFDVAPPNCIRSCRVRSRTAKAGRLLHNDCAGHFRMDRAAVGIRSRLGKRLRELFVRVHHLGLKHDICAHGRMRNVITVRSGNCCSDGYRDRLRHTSNPHIFLRHLVISSNLDNSRKTYLKFAANGTDGVP